MHAILNLTGRLIVLCLSAGVVLLVLRAASEMPDVLAHDRWSLAPAIQGLVDPALTRVSDRLGIAVPPQSQELLLSAALVLILGIFAVIAVLDAADQMHRRRRKAAAATAPPPSRAVPPAQRVVQVPAYRPPTPAALPAATPREAPAPRPPPARIASAAPPVRPAAAAPMDATMIVGSDNVRRIGRYEIIEELGRGAMGVVYKARDARIGRTVAIKTILIAGGDEAEQYRQRFLVEARSVGRLNHPGIVAVYDFTEDADRKPCLVLEFIDGVTLDKRVAKAGRLPLKQALDITAQVAQALHYAHECGIVHRDIKPPNVMLTRDDRAKVSDFGIAKLEGTNLTVTGQILGTPSYMSPEQFTGEPIDRRADIFSLGSVLYWLCTGERPFPGKTVSQVTYKLVNENPAPALSLNAELPAEIDRILGRCLAKRPDDRYPTAAALAADLAAIRP